MAREDLIPLNKRTKEEQKVITTMGGIASGISRNKRKTLKETLLLLLEDGKIQEDITLALLHRAASGDTKAFEVLRDSIGEKQREQVELGNIDDKPFEIKVDIVK